MKQGDAKMIANEVLNAAREENMQAGSSYKPEPITNVNIEKIENGFLIQYLLNDE